MRKLSFLSGLVVGFVLGSRSGSATYERLANAAKSIARIPEVQETLDEGVPVANPSATGVVAA